MVTPKPLYKPPEEMKPEIAQMEKKIVLPSAMMPAMSRTMQNAAKASQKALEIVGNKLSTDDPMYLALRTASNPLNIKEIKLTRG